MRKVLCVAMVVAVGFATLPGTVLMAGADAPYRVAPTIPAPQPGGTVQGQALDQSKSPMAETQVRLRPVKPTPGQAMPTVTTDKLGNFVFTNVTPGDWVVEILNAALEPIGVSAPISVTSAAVSTVTVTASAVSALAVAAGSTGIMAWVTSATGLTLLGALVTSAVIVGVLSQQDDASPSR